MAEQASANPQARPQQQFAMQRLYTKDLSFESPASPAIFRTQDWSPQVNVELNMRHTTLDEQGVFEVVLTLTLTAKVGEQTAFLCEVQQAGIFIVRGFEGEDLRRVLGTAAPTALFPYARETVDSVVVKGGFPAVMLTPVNFDALYVQQMRARSEAAGSEAAAH